MSQEFDPCSAFGATMALRAEAILMNATPAGDRIFVGRSWPLKPEDMDAIIILFVEEDQTSKGKGAMPQFDSQPKLVLEFACKGDDARELFIRLHRFRQLGIDRLMTSVDFLAAPLEQVLAIKSVMLAKDQQYQYHRAQVQFTLQTTEVYQPGPFPDLTLVDVKLLDPKGRTVAETKFFPQSE